MAKEMIFPKAGAKPLRFQDDKLFAVGSQALFRAGREIAVKLAFAVDAVEQVVPEPDLVANVFFADKLRPVD